MTRRAARFVASLVLGVAVAACASDSSPTTSESIVDSEPSFACIEAINATGLNAGSTVGQARQNLQDLINDSLTGDSEKQYYEALLGAIEGEPDTATIDETLDAVACELT